VRPEIAKHVLEMLTLMLAPMTPHLAEELWEMLGHTEGLSSASWPAFDPELARDEEVEVVVQVNGRVRARMESSRRPRRSRTHSKGSSRARRSPAHQRQARSKTIVVPDKLVNLVVA